MDKWSLIDKISPQAQPNIAGTITLSSFIDKDKKWNREKLKTCFPH